MGELFAYFAELIERRRADPGDDTISHLVQAGDGAGVSPLQILGFAFTMVTGGNDTTTGLLGGGLGLLPPTRRSATASPTTPTLIPAAVEELLRLTSPVQGLARTTTAASVEVDGHR